VFVCVSVCFPAQYLKTDAARIAKFDVQIFRDESWKTVYFGIKRSKVKVTSDKTVAGVRLCTLVSAGFSQFQWQLAGDVFSVRLQYNGFDTRRLRTDDRAVYVSTWSHRSEV